MRQHQEQKKVLNTPAIMSRQIKLKRCSLTKSKTLCQAMKDMGNPFQEESQGLPSLDTKDIAHQTAAELIGTHYEESNIHSQEFLKGLEDEETSTFYEPIKKKRVDFFQQEAPSADS